MVEIHLYGKLRQYAQDPNGNHAHTIRLEPNPDDTIASLMRRLEIPVDEINHVFYNANLLASRNKMASYMGFQQADGGLSNWSLDMPVDSGDRIGLFGADMSILGM